MNLSILTVNNIVATMTSLELVERINKARRIEANEAAAENECREPVMLRHDNFMAKLEKHPGIDSPKFLGQYKDGTGRTLKCYFLPKRECELMIMSESLLVQTRVYDQLVELTAQTTAPVVAVIPQSLAAALRLAADQAEQIEAQQAQLAIAAHKADALDRIAGATGSITIREAAKDLQVKPLAFSNWLREHKWIYKQGRSNLAHQPRIDAGLMAHKVTLVEVEGEDGVTFEKPVTQARITHKGLAKLAVAFGEVAA